MSLILARLRTKDLNLLDVSREGAYDLDGEYNLSHQSEMVNSKGLSNIIQELPEEEQTQTNRRKNRFANSEDRPIETEFTKRLREEATLTDQQYLEKRNDI